jgi:DNA repair protein RecN (Recombination protein N)
LLANLKIESIAIIESASIDFMAGLNVMSGETGAGKSIIIDSINAVLGHRTSKELVRTGENNAKVSALFLDVDDCVLSKLKELDILAEDDGSVVISRSIGADGKNICKINGCPVTVGMLKGVGKDLINIHGQHDNQALLNSENHCDFIDLIARHDDLLCEYKQAYHKIKELETEINMLNIDELEKVRKTDLLKHQINELELADIRVGQREELQSQREIYQNSEKIMESLQAAYLALNGGDDLIGAAGLASLCAENLENAARYVPKLNKQSQDIRTITYDLNEHVADIRDLILDFEYDKGEIEQTELRLDMLYRLSLKYGGSEEEMLDYLKKSKAELDGIMFSDQRLSKLKSQLIIANENGQELADRLSGSRRETGEIFAQKVKQELVFLNMPAIEFVVKQSTCRLNEGGQDEIEFLISANIGEPPKPLSKIASGGELSRIMLSIKNVVSSRDGTGTLIFDEIDTGVSGRAAQKIAQKLYQVSRGRQVICVTHSAQIAAYADNHLLISKDVQGSRTYTKVEPLNIEQRKEELARIMAGGTITRIQLENAQEMLSSAKIIQEDLKQ